MKDTQATDKINNNRCGTVREFTIECCVNCDVPKVPSNKHWWKCQNKHCVAFDEPTANASYHKCFVPIADIEVSKRIAELDAELAHMTEKFERNSIAAGTYCLERDRLKSIIAKELNENDEFGCEFVMVNILRCENDKLRAFLTDLRAKNANEDLNPKYLNERIDEVLV